MLDPNQGFSCQESAFGTKNESDAELTELIIRKYTVNSRKIQLYKCPIDVASVDFRNYVNHTA